MSWPLRAATWVERHGREQTGSDLLKSAVVSLKINQNADFFDLVNVAKKLMSFCKIKL